MAAYRSTCHPSTGYSPNMLVFGREVNIPGDLLFPFPRPEDPPDVHEYVVTLREKMEECYHIVWKDLKQQLKDRKGTMIVELLNTRTKKEILFTRKLVQVEN